MAMITRSVVNRKVFALNPADNTLTAEISDFGPEFNFSPIYDDACDIGLAMQTRDGGLAHFYVSGDERDIDGDIQVWHLEACPETARKYPAAANTKIILFND